MASFLTSSFSSVVKKGKQYQLGDIANATIGYLKSGATAYTGKDTYKFGDVSKKTLYYITKLVPQSSVDSVYFSEVQINEEIIDQYDVLETENNNNNTNIKSEVHNVENSDKSTIIGNKQIIHNKLSSNETENIALNSDIIFARLESYDVIPNQTDPHERTRYIRKLNGKESEMRRSEELVTALSFAFWSPNVPTPYVYTPEKVTVGTIWDAFFSQSYDLAIQCMKLGVLFIDDFVSEEPFLFIGLPAFILAEAIHRSLTCDDGFVLSNGLRLTSDNCPGEEKLLYNLLNKLRKCMTDFQPTSIELCVLKLRVLFACDEDREIPNDLLEQIEKSRMIKINIIAGEVTGVAIHLTQEAIFKKNFGKSLGAIVERFAEKD